MKIITHPLTLKQQIGNEPAIVTEYDDTAYILIRTTRHNLYKAGGRFLFYAERNQNSYGSSRPDVIGLISRHKKIDLKYCRWVGGNRNNPRSPKYISPFLTYKPNR